MQERTGERASAAGPTGADAAAPLLEEVRRFAYPRFAGGPGERKAGDEVASAFAAAGLEVRREPFRTSRSAVFRLRMFAHSVGAVTVLMMAAAGPSHPGTAAILGLVCLLLLAASGRWNRRLEGAFDVGSMVDSENVIGGRAGKGPDALCLVVMAHRDTKSSTWPTFVPAMVLLSTVVFLVVATALAAAAWGRGEAGPALVLPAWIIAAALLAVPFNRSADGSPGAMDNASGVAVLLAAARDLPGDEILRDVELRFVCTGAEELGLAGAMRWIRRHAEELDSRRTVVVNVDSVGVGHRVLAVDVRGHAPGGRSMRIVVQAAARAAGAPLRVLNWLPAVGVDSMPVSARGFATVTLLGEVLGGASRRIHSERDTAGHLNERGLRNALRVVREIGREVVAAAPR